MPPLFCVRIFALLAAATATAIAESKGLAQAAPSAPLRLRASSAFTLLQFADLHYGEAPALDWGPEQDRNSTRVMRAVLAAEAPVGLVVFSGDQITGNNVVDNATAVLANVYGEVVRQGVQWAVIYGNHDDAPLDAGLPSPARARRLSVTTRRELLAFERATWPAVSLTCAAVPGAGMPAPCPTTLAPAVSNYFQLVLGPEGDVPILVLYFLDSGGGSYDEDLYAGATAWLGATAAALAARFGAPVPSLTFVHIPPPEYTAAASSRSCVGMADDGITPTTGQNNLIATLAATGAARATFVGHDHGNAWCCPTKAAAGLSLCFGRHTGYGGYGTWDRGARVVSISVNATAPGGVGVRTWVRMEDNSTNSEQWL